MRDFRPKLRARSGLVAPSPELVAEVEATSLHVWSREMVDGCCWREEDGVTHLSNAYEHVGLLANSGSSEAVTKSACLREHASPERHVCPDPVVNGNQFSRVSGEVGG